MKKFLGKLILIIFAVGSLLSGLSFLAYHFLDPKQNSSGNVAVIKIEGPIFESEDVLQELRDIREDTNVKAVVVRIDSPGGSVGASQEIYRSLLQLKAQKTVVASLGTIAASGGYYVALPAHKIIANEGTITGSIGVKMQLINLENLMKWALLEPLTLKSGALKDIGSVTRPMTEEEKEFLNALLVEMHGQFKKSIVESRSLPSEKVEELAEGQIFTGATALQKGLVDELGNFDDAIRVAGELAGIKEKPEIFYPGEKYKKFWQEFVEGETKTIVNVLAQNILGYRFY